jgi:vacuolar protein sorting-associated protein 13A/C
VVNKITASLTGIQLVSNLYADSDLSTLKIVDDIDVTADIVQTSAIDRNKDSDYPDTQVFGMALYTFIQAHRRSRSPSKSRTFACI